MGTPLAANFTHTAPQCYCTDINFYGTATGGSPEYNYSWDFGDESGSAYGQNQNHHYDENILKTYIVNLTVTDSGTNTTTVSKNVQVWPTPVADFTTKPQPQIYCLPITFNGSAIGGTPGYNWSWNFNDSSPTSYGQNQSHTYGANGTYNVTLTVKDVHNCTNSKTKPVDALNYTAELNVTKEADHTSATVDDVIKYWINVTNTGNVSLSSVEVSDSKLGLSDTIAILAPNQTKSYNLTYTVNESDICNRWINNTATANNATDPCNVSVGPVEDSWTVSTEYNSSISINKTASTHGPVAPGDTIDYEIKVCNTGNLTLYNVTVNDSRFGIDDLGTLAKGACNWVNTTYVVTEQDICNLSIVNYANVTADDYCNNNVSDGPVSWTVSTEYNAAIAIDKTASTLGPAAPGDSIDYWIKVCNTGNLTLYNVSVNDSRFGTHDLDTLTKGACKWFNTTYVVTEQDICNVSIVNYANVTGVDYCNNNVSDGPVSWTVSTEYNSSISINKTASTHGPVAPGDSINYWIKVCNTGNLTLYNVTVNDSRFGIDDLGTLAKGACNWFNTTYVVTEQDICNVSIVNYANVTADDYCNNNVSAGPVSWTVNTEYNASISIDKTASTHGPVAPGDSIDYWIKVCNTGNLTLYNLTL
ncbi:MAG: PKD domain-containing protein [Halobacteriota archaeon]